MTTVDPTTTRAAPSLSVVMERLARVETRLETLATRLECDEKATYDFCAAIKRDLQGLAQRVATLEMDGPQAVQAVLEYVKVVSDNVDVLGREQSDMLERLQNVEINIFPHLCEDMQSLHAITGDGTHAVDHPLDRRTPCRSRDERITSEGTRQRKGMRPQGLYDVLKEAHHQGEGDKDQPVPEPSRLSDAPVSPSAPTYAEKLVDLQYQPLSEEERDEAAMTLATQELQGKFAANKMNQHELRSGLERLSHTSYKSLMNEAQLLAKTARHKALDRQRWDGEITRAQWRQSKLETAEMSLEALNKDARDRSHPPRSPAKTHGHDIER